MTNQKGSLSLIVGILVIIIFATAGGMFFWRAYHEPTLITGPLATHSPLPSPVSSWKTLTSEAAGYTLQYPPEWPLISIPVLPECTVCVENIVFTPEYDPNLGDGNIAVILVLQESEIQTLEDYINLHVTPDANIVDLQSTQVGGEKAISYKLVGGIPPLPVIEYAVVKNGKYYLIRLEDSAQTNKNRAQNLEYFERMLTTIQFIP